MSKMLNNSNSLAMSGPPHFVDLHVNPGESVSIQLFDGNETLLRGPATITMISQHTFPPIPMPVQVPPGHMVQQIVDENGTLRHIILSAVSSNGTTSPATTLVPPPPTPQQQQQQPYPYCCCCCYCNSTPTPMPPPPPLPPPPPPTYNANLLTFPAPVNLRRRFPTRNFSYTKRSTTASTTTNTFHSVSTKSPSRGKPLSLSNGQESISKMIIPPNSISEQNCELTTDGEKKASNSKTNSFTPSPKSSPKAYAKANCVESFIRSDSLKGTLLSNEEFKSDVKFSTIDSDDNDDGIEASQEEDTVVNCVDTCQKPLDNQEIMRTVVDRDTDCQTKCASASSEEDNLTQESENNAVCDTYAPLKSPPENESQHKSEDEARLKKESSDVIDLENTDKSEVIRIEKNELSEPNTTKEVESSLVMEDNTQMDSCKNKDDVIDGATSSASNESEPSLGRQGDLSGEDSELEETTAIEVLEPEVKLKASPNRSPKHLLPQLQVWNLTYTSLTATTVKLKWSPQSGSNHSSGTRHYMVEMILNKSNENSGSPVPATRIVYQGNMSSCRVSHLNSAQQYSFRVRTVSDEHLLVSNVLTITTPEQPLNKHHKRSKQQSLQQQIQQQMQQRNHLQVFQQQHQVQHQQQFHSADSFTERNEYSVDKSDQKCAIIILLSFTVVAVIVASLIQQLLSD